MLSYGHASIWHEGPWPPRRQSRAASDAPADYQASAAKSLRFPMWVTNAAAGESRADDNELTPRRRVVGGPTPCPKRPRCAPQIERVHAIVSGVSACAGQGPDQ